MPYNNPYYSPAYQQPMPQMPTMPQIPAQPMSIPTQPQYPQYTYIVVSSEDEVDRIPLELGSQIFALDLNHGKAYVRKRDSMGQYSTEKFIVSKEETAPSVDYVTKEEFESFKKMITEAKENE